MSTIADLIARIEADQRALTENLPMKRMIEEMQATAKAHEKLIAMFEPSPAAKRMMEEMEAFAKCEEKLLKQFELAPGLQCLIAEAEEMNAQAEKWRKHHEEIAKIAASFKTSHQSAAPDLPYIAPRVEPVIHIAPAPEPLPKRTIVRKQLKRTIGFTKKGFRPKD